MILLNHFLCFLPIDHNLQNQREVTKEIHNIHAQNESVRNLHQRREDADSGASEREGPGEQRELARVSLLEIGPDLWQATRESEARSDDGNEILQLELREEMDTDRLRNEADGNAAEKKKREVAKKQAPGDVGILCQTTSQSPFAYEQVEQKNEHDVLK